MSSNLLRKELLSMALPYRSLGIAASVLLLVVALPAKAERAMSCPDFRLALWRAIDDDGNKVARPQFDKAAGGFGPMTSYEMTEIVGLEGRLNCSDHQIFGFSAKTRLSTDPTETASHILRLKSLAAAAICALSSPQPTLQECTSLTETIVRGAMDERARARASGEAHRYVGARLNGGSRIETEAYDDNLAFFLYSF